MLALELPLPLVLLPFEQLPLAESLTRSLPFMSFKSFCCDWVILDEEENEVVEAADDDKCSLSFSSLPPVLFRIVAVNESSLVNSSLMSKLS